MANWDNRDPEQRHETVEPQNPPNSVIDPELRKSPAFAVVGIWYYLGPIAIVVLVIVFALMFLRARDNSDEGAVPTTGMEQEAPAQRQTPGGFEPAPRPDRTEEELERRGF